MVGATTDPARSERHVGTGVAGRAAAAAGGLTLALLTWWALTSLPAGVWDGARPATCLDTSCFCEALRGGPVRQPVNTLTSLAFTVVGGWVLGGAFGAGVRHRRDALLLGAGLLLTGEGSAFYHAGLTFTGQLFDVLGMNLVAGFMVLKAVERLRPTLSHAVAGYAAYAVGVAVVLWLLPGTRRGLFAVTLLLAVALEHLAAHRDGGWRRLRPLWAGARAVRGRVRRVAPRPVPPRLRAHLVVPGPRRMARARSRSGGVPRPVLRPRLLTEPPLSTGSVLEVQEERSTGEVQTHLRTVGIDEPDSLVEGTALRGGVEQRPGGAVLPSPPQHGVEAGLAEATPAGVFERADVGDAQRAWGASRARHVVLQQPRGARADAEFVVLVEHGADARATEAGTQPLGVGLFPARLED